MNNKIKNNVGLRRQRGVNNYKPISWQTVNIIINNYLILLLFFCW